MLRNFNVRTYVNFTRVNKIETILVGRSRVNVKLLRLRAACHTLPLCCLRAYTRENYATIEILL